MFSALFYSDQSRSLFLEVLFGSLFWETDLYFCSCTILQSVLNLSLMGDTFLQAAKKLLS